MPMFMFSLLFQRSVMERKKCTKFVSFVLVRTDVLRSQLRAYVRSCVKADKSSKIENERIG